MRASRIAAIAVLGAAAFGASAVSAYADESGQVEAKPHAVKAGHVVRFSTESCEGGSAMVHVDIDGVRHDIALDTQTDEGATGWFTVPLDTDPGWYEVEGQCANGDGVEGHFRVKHHHHHHVED